MINEKIPQMSSASSFIPRCHVSFPWSTIRHLPSRIGTSRYRSLSTLFTLLTFAAFCWMGLLLVNSSRRTGSTGSVLPLVLLSSEKERVLHGYEAMHVESSSQPGQITNTSEDNWSRLRHLEQACRRLNLPSSASNSLPKQLVVVDKHKLIYCQVLKAGSTTMLELLIRILKVGYKSSNNTSCAQKISSNGRLRDVIQYGINRLHLQPCSEEEKYGKAREYFKFVIVRHPLERLVSGYYQRLVTMVRHDHNKKTTKQARNIVSRVRGVPLHKINPEDLTFEDFARHVCQPDEQLDLLGDDHFWSVAHVCSVCDLHYDYVAKLETFEEDLRHILPHLNTSVEQQHILHINGNKKYHKQYEEAYTSLPKDVLIPLLQKYQVDMQLFGYKMDDFFSETSLNILNSRGIRI